MPAGLPDRPGLPRLPGEGSGGLEALDRAGVQLLLECLLELQRARPEPVSRSTLLHCLRGTRPAGPPPVAGAGSKMRGVLRGFPRTWLDRLVDRAVESHWIDLEGSPPSLRGVALRSPRLRLSTTGHAALLELWAAQQPEERDPSGLASERPAVSGELRSLERTLHDLRREIASRLGLPAYRVFTNTTLAELVYRQPRTVEELAAISGLGPRRVEHFGELIIRTLREAAPGVVPPPGDPSSPPGESSST